MLLRAVPLVIFLAACGPGASMNDAGGDTAATPDAATADTFGMCSGPCASGCCVNNGCVDLQTDYGNCGVCGRACRTGQGCAVSGAGTTLTVSCGAD